MEKINNLTFVTALCVCLIIAALLPPARGALLVAACLYASLFWIVLPIARAHGSKTFKYAFGAAFVGASFFIAPVLGLIVGACGAAMVWSELSQLKGE